MRKGKNRTKGGRRRSMEEEYTMTVNHMLPCQPIQSRCSSVQMEASPLCTGGSHAETGRSSLDWKK